ncbi:MAG: 1-deoxy-D-xylulose-5-phosphate synthase [Candidatus Ratteibacteria bacterium]|jgi:1-deoxy-D-xylulose-5-phosphate synthase
MILDKINQTGDVKKLRPEELPLLTKEIRQLIIEVVAKNGGHLSSNLGVVELTIALHRLLDLEKDTLIWDVGHQTYTHKILTGRKTEFEKLRTYHGLSGFPEPNESATDPLRTGHSSTSIATGLGIACTKKEGKTVVVIGDASLSGGVAFEGLNQAAAAKANLCVILNANEMAISPTTGGLALSLTKVITNPRLENFRQHTRTLVQKMPFLGPETINFFKTMEEGVKNLLGPAELFEGIGFSYFGPFDGHNFSQLREALEKVLKLSTPRLVHVVTKKGKGYPPAEADPEHFHSANRFSITTGEPIAAPETEYREVFAEELVRQAEKKPEIMAITAAMTKGVGLQNFQKLYPERFFDVGIAEQAAVAFAAGLAKSGKRPVVAVYATFFQRAFDQVFQEICLQGDLPVTFILCNNGLVGPDGSTHHSLYSFSYLRSLPGLSILAPFSYQELRRLLAQSLKASFPTVILFPKNAGPENLETIEEPKAAVSILAAGNIAETARRAALRLKNDGVSVSFWPTSSIKPLDEEIIRRAAEANTVVTVEENSLLGGFGSAVLEHLTEKNLKKNVKMIGAPDRFVTFGSRPELLAEIGLDEEGIYKQIKNIVKM